MPSRISPVGKSILAAAILAALVLGITYAGAYAFCPATYSSSAVVRVPAAADPAAVRTYFAQQAQALPTDQRVLSAAWSVLEPRGLAGSDLKSWSRQLGLAVQADADQQTLTISCQAASGLAAAATANALADAYVEIVSKQMPAGQLRPLVTQHAERAVEPFRDRRRLIALSASAIVLFLILVAAITMRQTIRRQLSAIDDMAEPDDRAAAALDL
jgi:hypothetical protein